MSVRVVDDVTCEKCKGSGLIYTGTKLPAPKGTITRNVSGCVVCLGTGTVEREVRCDGCKWWRHRIEETRLEIGYCEELQDDSAPDWGCKDWEQRE